MSRSPISKKSSTYTPPHWPRHLRYLTAPQYHSSVNNDILEIIGGQGPPKSHQPLGSQPSFVVIRKITGPSNHPASVFVYVTAGERVELKQSYLQSMQAVGQFGLFAAKKIPSRMYLLDYLGEVHCNDRPSSDYDLSLYRTPDGSVSVGVDASAMGNEGRFVNDYRGIRQKPNARFAERRCDNGELRMTIWTGSEVIKKGEEILVSVGGSGYAHLTAIGIGPAGELRKVVVESPTTTTVVIVSWCIDGGWWKAVEGADGSGLVGNTVERKQDQTPEGLVVSVVCTLSVLYSWLYSLFLRF